MAEKMIGGSLKTIQKPAGRAFGGEKFVVNRLNLPGVGHFGIALRDVTFTVRAGEIFGIAGVAGNGQNALLLALSGEEPVDDAASITIDGAPIGTLNAKKRRLKGLSSVPEERNGHAAVPDFSLSDNSVLTGRDRLKLAVNGLIRPRAAKSYTGEVIATFAVKATGADAMAGSLSGGNLQKYIMGREILQKPTVLVVSQPTWGVDAGAAAALIERFPERFLFGTDVVAPTAIEPVVAVHDLYAPLWDALTPATREKVRKGNYERVFDAARNRVRAWERENVQ